MASKSIQSKESSKSSNDEPPKSSSAAVQAANKDKPPQDIPRDGSNQSRRDEIPVERNVIYNQETLKYMRIIDKYKKLGIGKDIELPRV
jgi:hypothetical protein